MKKIDHPMKRRDREKLAPIPSPKDPAMCEWWLEQFHSDGIPERVVLAQVLSGGKATGDTIKTWTYHSNQPRSQREILVAATNEAIEAAQSDCNSLRRTATYGLFAYNAAKSPDYYSRYCFVLDPRPVAIDGRVIEPDLDGSLAEAKMDRELLLESWRHLRWAEEQTNRKNEQLFNAMMTRMVEMERQQTEAFRERVALLKQMQDFDREKLRLENEGMLRRELVVGGIGMLRTVAPHALAHLGLAPPQQPQAALSPSSPPSQPQGCPEGLALAAAIRGMSHAERAAVFGLLDEHGRIVQPGILDREQVGAVLALAEGRVGADAIHQIAASVTTQQLEAIQRVVPTAKLVALGSALGLLGGDGPAASPSA